MQQQRKLVTADGEEYLGFGFGAEDEVSAELVFNTSMVGYQEIVSDPSYAGQAVVMTYPLIGNYGLAEEDYESARPALRALIVRDYNDLPSNFRNTASLSELLAERGVVGLTGVDTRRLTRSLRDQGSRQGLLTAVTTPREEAMARLAGLTLPHDLVAQVSCKRPWQAKTANHCCRVTVIDCGAKRNIVRSLQERGCNVTVLPWNVPAALVLENRPHGVLFSNGPGDPEDVTPVIQLARELWGRLPLFGICLGHQILSLAAGGRTYKLKFGHHGGNHPVRELASGKVEITSQNHNFAVDPNSLPAQVAVTHVNLLDNTVEGMADEANRVFSVQYHPESAPGPEDSGYLFDRFVRTMREVK